MAHAPRRARKGTGGWEQGQSNTGGPSLRGQPWVWSPPASHPVTPSAQHLEHTGTMGRRGSGLPSGPSRAEGWGEAAGAHLSGVLQKRCQRTGFAEDWPQHCNLEMDGRVVVGFENTGVQRCGSEPCSSARACCAMWAETSASLSFSCKVWAPAWVLLEGLSRIRWAGPGAWQEEGTTADGRRSLGLHSKQ